MGVVAKQFMHINGSAYVLGWTCQRVEARTARADVWRPETNPTLHAMENVVARCLWAPLVGSDMLVLKPSVYE